MKRLLLFIFAVLGFAVSAHAQGTCPAGSPVSGNHCFFISSASGSDSNNGTSESTPWAHAPAMSTATGNAAAHSYAPGEVYIFKGCDTWNFATIGMWTPSASGTSGNLIYWGGFDQTWYNTSVCPSAWNRPIFSGEGTWPGAAPSTGSTDYMMRMDENSYWRIAWIEWTGLYFSENVSNFNGSGGYFSCNTNCQNYSLDHNFMHGFTYTLSTSCTVSGSNYPCGEPYFASFQSTEGNGAIQYNVFGNGDITGTCASCSFAGDNLGLWINGSNAGSMDHNWFQGGDCWVGSFAIIHDNTYYGCGPFSAAANSVHNNTFENNSDPGSGTVMYNNLLEHSGTVGNASVSQLAPAGNTSYFFNNVITDELSGYDGGQLPFNCAGNGGGGTCWAFNNTIECGSDSAGLGPSQAPPSLQCISNNPVNTALNVYYNHFITSLGGVQCAGSGCTNNITPNPNLTQTQTAANAQGYTLATLFAPQNSGAATIQTGYSPSGLSSLCSSVSGLNSTAGTACQSSTTCGITLLTSPYYNVGSSGCTSAARFVSGGVANDSGAFQFAGGGPVGPPPVVLLTKTLPPGTVGVVYTDTLTASGGTPPYLWSGTNFPAGLSLSAAGVLSGTPTTTCACNVSVTVSDSSSPQLTASGQFLLTVNPGTPPPTNPIQITVTETTNGSTMTVSGGWADSAAGVTSYNLFGGGNILKFGRGEPGTSNTMTYSGTKESPVWLCISDGLGNSLCAGSAP